MNKQNTNELELISKFDQLLLDSKKSILESTIKDPKELDKLLDVYKKIKITNIDSKAESDHLEMGLRELKKIRLAIDKNRKALTEPAISYQKELIEFAKPWLESIITVEDHLKSEKQKYEDMVQAEKNRLFTERATLLSENGYQLQNGFYISGPVQVKADSISDLDQSQIDYYVKLGQQELDRKKAELEREERLNQREKELAAKSSEMDKKLAELNAKLAELSAQEVAIEKTYEEIKVKKVAEKVTENTSEKPAEKPTEKVAESIPSNDLFPEPTEYQKGFNDCRKKVLEILKDKASFEGKLVVLFDMVKKLQF